jgi:hypothetical protein
LAFKYFDLSVPNGYSRNELCTLNLISTFFIIFISGSSTEHRESDIVTESKVMVNYTFSKTYDGLYDHRCKINFVCWFISNTWDWYLSVNCYNIYMKTWIKTRGSSEPVWFTCLFKYCLFSSRFEIVRKKLIPIV